MIDAAFRFVRGFFKSRAALIAENALLPAVTLFEPVPCGAGIARGCGRRPLMKTQCF